MDWIKSVKNIRDAQQNNQLVIFVGAGISRNSGVVSWGQLVEAIAQKIDYEKCFVCSDKDSCERHDKCKFTQDEYLRIPEYFYQKDTSKEKTEYYSFLKETLGTEKSPNPIDEEVFRILPHHIITTNYDHLLEKCDAANVRLYNVVAEDKDLLSTASERYLIKMHGDIEKEETIVLREGDYIDYEPNHPLISTFIKSLLVNHTFMFIGYSLNDYNLNLIIGWINYFRKSLGVQKRPTNILINETSASEFEAKRLLDKKIAVIGLDSLPPSLENDVKIPESLTYPAGRKLYAYLKCITDDTALEKYIPLKDVLFEKYKIFSPYSKISHQDFISAHSFGKTIFMGTELVFMEREWYERVADLLNEKESIITRTFQKAGITAIHFSEDDRFQEVPQYIDEIDPLLSLYQNNDYITLFEKAKSIKNYDRRRYYYNLILSKYKMDTPTDEETDYISILMHKMRCRLFNLTMDDRRKSETAEIEQLLDTATPKYRSVIKMLSSLFHSTANDEKNMQKILSDQEKRYQYHINGWISGAAHQELWKLQAYAYDYYFFIIKNAIPLERFNDSKIYLSYYIKAVLCSYSPVEKGVGDAVFGIETQREFYPIGPIELDIMIKFSNPKDFLSWIKKYSVTQLVIEPEIDTSLIYKNLCDSFIKFKNIEWINQIFVFSIIVGMIPLKHEEEMIILDSLSEILEKLGAEYENIGYLLFESIDWVAKSFTDGEVKAAKNRLMRAIFRTNIYHRMAEKNEVGFSRIINNLVQGGDWDVQSIVYSNIASIEAPDKKCKEIHLLRKILPKTKYTDYLLAHLDAINPRYLFDLVYEKIIPYNEEVAEYLFSTIQKEAENRQKNPALRSFPDFLAISINQCIYLKLLGKPVDFSCLIPYVQYSDTLEFLCDPEKFDYNKVDTKDLMWQNLIFSPEYGHYFVEHKNDILTDDLKKLFDQGLETRAQQKIVYGILLAKERLSSF